MSGYVFDPFNPLPVGTSVVPPGWHSDGAATIKAGSAGGPYPPHNWGSVAASFISTPVFSTIGVAAVTLWFAFGVDRLNAGPNVTAFVPTLSAPGTGPIFILSRENDLTISGTVANGVFCANSGITNPPFSAHQGLTTPGNWYYAQLNLTLNRVPVIVGTSTQTFVGVSAQLGIDGVQVFTGSNTSSILATNLTGVGVSQFEFQASTDLAEIIVADLVPIGSYPQGVWTIAITSGGTGYDPQTTTISFSGGGGNQAAATAIVSTSGTSSGQVVGATITAGGLGYSTAPLVVINSVVVGTLTGTGSGAAAVATLAPAPFVRASQMAVEVLESPTSSEARISQMAVEVQELPTSAAVRIPQMVIELAGRHQTISIPQYIKRFNAPGH